MTIQLSSAKYDGTTDYLQQAMIAFNHLPMSITSLSITSGQWVCSFFKSYSNLFYVDGPADSSGHTLLMCTVILIFTNK